MLQIITFSHSDGMSVKRHADISVLHIAILDRIDLYRNIFFSKFVWLIKMLVIMSNHQLSQKFKLIEKGKFNHLINTLKLPLTYGLKLPF
jgi:hypothetical protein